MKHVGFIAFSFLYSIASFGQASTGIAPGGVSTPAVWSFGGDQELVSNYRALDLLDGFMNLNPQDFQLDKSSTLFFVLKPKTVGSSELFLRTGDVAIYGDRVIHGRATTPINFIENQPLLLSVEIQRSGKFGLSGNADLALGDSNLFSLAELVVYEGLLNREDRRKVNTYLALKYGLPITTNKEPEWRDYLAQDDSHYWDVAADRVYENRVLALGRSDQEGLFQSQTIAETGSEFCVALDSVLKEGQMPNVRISDESFIVFSEKSTTPSLYYNCQNNYATSELHKWKFRLTNWDSDAHNIVIRIKRPDELDSLFLTDGQSMKHVPYTKVDSRSVWYSISLDDLVGNRNYFFTNREAQQCRNVNIGLKDDLISAISEELDDSWGLEVQDLHSGVVEFVPANGGEAYVYRNEGQYLVRVLDSNENEISSKVVYVEDNASISSLPTNQVELLLYPNPVESNTPSTLEINHLTETGEGDILITDASGRIVLMDRVQLSESIVYQFQQNTPGIYTITIRTNTRSYSLKFVVKTSL